MEYFNALKGVTLPLDIPIDFLPTTHVLSPAKVDGVWDYSQMASNFNVGTLNWLDEESPTWDNDEDMLNFIYGVRANYPGARFGVYGYMPTRYTNVPKKISLFNNYNDVNPDNYTKGLVDYIHSLNNVPQMDSEEPQFRNMGAWLDRLSVQSLDADLVDFYLPSLYAFEDGSEGLVHWLRYATENIRQLKDRFPEKAIYPFIWPYLHTSNHPENTECEYWADILDFCQDNCDGAVIWTKSTTVADDTSPWWQELLTRI